MLFKEIISFRIYRDYPLFKILLFILPPLLVSFALGLQYGFLYIDDPFTLPRILYPTFTKTIQFITDYGSTPLYLAYTYLIFDAFSHRKKEQGIFCTRGLIAISIIFALVMILKNSLGIPRPSYDFPIRPWSGLWEYQAIPSGHTVEIIALSLPLALWFYSKTSFTALVSLATVVIFSRVWLGVHHPLDLIVAILIGLVAALLALTKNPAKASS